MPESADTRLIASKYQEAFGVSLAPGFGTYMSHGDHTGPGAALGFRCADAEPLFLERYLDAPIEDCVASVFV
ncbi:MAG: thermostable hemolysin, partial [Novosphingobium sp.]|nr:thermostable hemolysin [Novosphingobium sp.]